MAKADLPLSAQNKPENEIYPYVSFPPSCRRSEGGDGRLKATAAAITLIMPVFGPRADGRLINAHLCRFAHFAASGISLRFGALWRRLRHVPKYDDHT